MLIKPKKIRQCIILTHLILLVFGLSFSLIEAVWTWVNSCWPTRVNSSRCKAHV